MEPSQKKFGFRAYLERTKSLSHQLLFGVSLVNLSLFDQFRNPVELQRFESVPKVLVFASKKTADQGQGWGRFLGQTYNPSYEPDRSHLTRVDSGEKVKVVAVASLPRVPDFFKGIFYTGFEERHPHMPMILDFGGQLAEAFSVPSVDQYPALVLLDGGPWELVHSKALVIHSSFPDEANQKRVVEFFAVRFPKERFPPKAKASPEERESSQKF